VKLEFRVVVEDEELAMLYSQAIATIYCPHLEPFGLVSLESMACGTPVLGVAEGGVRETILHEKTGFLLPWKPAAFARTLLRLRADRGLLERMGCFGTEWVRQQFTWRRTAESVSDVIGRNFEPGLPRVSDRISWARG
jgi:glycosyltransferase involved in cell wall biosynthesis